MDEERKKQVKDTVQIVTQRVIRAAKLDSQLYQEVEGDPAALGQALWVVILSGLAAGFGTIGMVGGYGEILLGTLSALVGWFVWAFLTYWIGTRLLPEPQTHADLGQLLRTIGFSSSPGLIRILGILPGFTGIVFLVAAIWMLVAMVVAVKEALDYQSTWRAVGVCLIGWVIQVIALALLVRLAMVGLNQ